MKMGIQNLVSGKGNRRLDFRLCGHDREGTIRHSYENGNPEPNLR